MRVTVSPWMLRPNAEIGDPAHRVSGEAASRARTDRLQLPRLLRQIGPGDVMIGDSARSASDLLNTLAAIHREEESRVSIPRRRMGQHYDAHGRLMLTVLGGWQSSISN
jgi:hypothetical protein